MQHSHSRRLALLATAPVLALALAGCGGSSSTGSPSTAGGGSSKPAVHVTKNAALAAKVPSAIASDGTITVGTDATYAPNEFLAQDGKTVIGFDVDLFDAVAATLGLKASYAPDPVRRRSSRASARASTRSASPPSPSTATARSRPTW